MIDLKGKGLFTGTLGAVPIAGHWARFEDGVWITSDDIAVQEIIDSFTLDQAKAEIKAKVTTLAKAIRDKIVSGTSPGEMASWPIKFAEASAYSANPSAVTPMLTTEATQRGVTVESIAVRVTVNAVILGRIEANIAGTQGRHNDNLKALTTFDDVAAYDFSTGWPA